MLEQTSLLISQIGTITNQNSQAQTNWLVQVGQNLQSLEKIEDGVIMLQAKVLYEVWSLWESKNNDEGRFLNQEATRHWQYNFYSWAKVYTKRRALKEPDDTTINNKIRVYRNWTQLIEPPQTVLIPKRDEFGNETEEIEEIDFNFEDCDYGKLLVSTVQARKGEMSPDTWSALRDPQVTTHKLREKLGQVKQKDQSDDFYVTEQDGIIYGCQNETRKAVLQVLWENDEGDDLFSKTLCYALRAMGIQVPLTYQRG